MKKTKDPQPKIDPAHADGRVPHDREQLRRRLLKMILHNEAQRRNVGPARRDSANSRIELAVFDPEDRIGQEMIAASTPNKRA
jgi:hypothetical protein